MSQKSKVLFLATDNITGAGRSWDRESAEIQDAISREGNGEQFTLITRPGVDSRRLLSLMLNEDPEVLHIISEVSEKQILLPNSRGEKIPQNPENLAKLFRQFRSTLRWVVLSGCFSHEQAAAISHAIPSGAVMGFDSEMLPDHRIRASVGMYLALKSEKNKPAQVAGISRSYLELEGGSGTQLYLYQDGKEVSIDEESGQQRDDPVMDPGLSDSTIKWSDHIGNKSAYYCDRIQQRHEFLHPFENDQRTFNFFAVHGSTPQSHHGLIESFYHQFLFDEFCPEASRKYRVVLQQADDLDKYKAEIRSKLLKEMKMGKLLRLDDDIEMTEAARRFGKQEIDTVAVEFRVKSSYWKEFTPELIQWFISVYCKIRDDAVKAPAFYFFLSIIYEEEVDHLTSLVEIRQLVNKLPDCNILTELKQVEKADILTWIETHISSDSRRQQNIWQTYFFENSPSYDMEVVQRRLDTIITSERPDI